jgi:hypothetical protein
MMRWCTCRGRERKREDNTLLLLLLLASIRTCDKPKREGEFWNVAIFINSLSSSSSFPLFFLSFFHLPSSASLLQQSGGYGLMNIGSDKKRERKKTNKTFSPKLSGDFSPSPFLSLFGFFHASTIVEEIEGCC